MKILYVVDYYQPQLGYSEYYLPRELKKLGHTVWILTSNYYYPFPNYEQSSGKILGPRKQQTGERIIEGIRVIKEQMKFEVFTRAIFFNHHAYLDRLRPDIVIVNKSAGFNTIRMAQLKDKYGYKLLSYDAHLPSGFYAVGNIWVKRVFYFLFRLFFARLLNAKVDQFVAVQEETITIMKHFYGQKNIVHIPLGTDTGRFRYSAEARNEVRRKLGMKSTDFVIVYSGKIVETKGITILCQAHALLVKKYPSLKTILVGNGPDEYLQKCFAHLSDDERKSIYLLGFQHTKNLYKYYSAADVGVWPLEESTSMNDLAACQRPFICNHTIGAKVRLSNKNALIYKKGDEKDLAKKIEYLINNRAESKKMGRRGYDLVIKRLSWSSIVKEYLSYVT